MAKSDVAIQSQQALLQNLEIQLGQLATELWNRPLGKLPTDAKTQKREGKEQCQVIELRSGKEILSRGWKIKQHADSHSQEVAVEKEHIKNYAEPV